MQCDCAPFFTLEIKITRLTELGFSREDCIEALKNYNERVDDAAMWLTINARPVEKTPSQGSPKLAGFEVR